MQRRDIIKLMGASGALMMVDPLHAQAGGGDSITGPIHGGRHGRVFAGYLGNIGDVGYVEEEYFIDGIATSFAPSAPLGIDGKWSVAPSGTAPYRTRIIVRRPIDASRFNGTVIVEWINVSAGYDVLVHDLPSLYRSGFVYVGVSAQYVGINGMGDQPVGLKQWDPERYGSLQHPGESFCYDIFTQGAKRVGPRRPTTGVDPLAGLAVKRLIGVGASQSAMRLTSYVNAIQPIARVFDGFVAAVSFGVGSGFDDTVLNPNRLPRTEHPRPPGMTARVRDDLGVPMMVINSETEVLAHAAARRPESATYCFWEIAGASHVSLPALGPIGAKNARDFPGAQVGLGPDTVGPDAISHIAWNQTVDSGTLLVDQWIRTGRRPSSQPLIQLSADGMKVIRDSDGNAVGGVRLPEMAVPIAENDGLGNALFGHHRDFTRERLRQLYPTHQIYVTKVETAARACERDGTLTAESAKASIEAARRTAAAWS